MELSDRDLDLVEALCDGLPISARPFAEIGAACGLDEAEVIARIKAMLAAGVIKRMGVIVHHRALGYRANAMVVWDIPDDEVDVAGTRLGACPGVTLCYRRPRCLPAWPYNLFTMIHGRDRHAVETLIADIAARTALSTCRREVLFSLRHFKQCGARYSHRQMAE